MSENRQNRFISLLNDLSASKFDITAEQRVRALGLYMRLTLRGQMLRSSRLANSIGPVLCRTAEEQVTFHRIFRYWFPEEIQWTVPATATATPEADAARKLEAERRAAAEESLRWLREAQRIAFRKQLRFILITAFVLLLLAHGARMGLHLIAFKIGPPAVTGPVAATKPNQSPPLILHNGDIGQKSQIQPLPQAPQAQNPTPKRQPEASSDNRFLDAWETIEHSFGPLATLVLMIPLTLLAILATSTRKLLSAFARQSFVIPRNELRNFLSSGGTRLETSADFYRLIQPLRRRIEVASSSVLDLDQTIGASVENGGAFTPVYRSLLVSPEYVVLVDLRSHADHVAAQATQLIDTLEQAGVNVVVYYFDRDPRRFSLGPQQRVLDLDDLVAISQSRRLLIFSDGEGLVDPSTGSPFEWTAAFQEWDPAILLTWKDPRDWYRAEWLLDQGVGLRVLPANEAGLLIAAEIFNAAGEDSVPTSMPNSRLILPDRGRLYGFFVRREGRWIDDLEPSEQEINDLFERLTNSLSKDALVWLSALAVYPAIYFSLTLYLGVRMFPEISRDHLQDLLLQIAGLPWLRYARMPRWLRRRLIDTMAPETRTVIYLALDEMLMTVSSAGVKDVALEMGVNRDDLPDGTRHRIDRENYRNDPILVDFMTRKRAMSEDFPLHRKIIRALGLESIDSSIRELLARSDRHAMRTAAGELESFVDKYPPKTIRTEIPREPLTKIEVLLVTEWIDTTTNNAVPLQQRLCLIKRDPRSTSWTVIDEMSLALWEVRKKMTLKFGLIGLAVLTLALATYGAYWDTVVFGGTLVVGGIIYFPFMLLWLLLVRPYSKIVQQFPSVHDSDIS